MALSRFVVTSTVVLPPEVLTAIAGGFGSAGGTAAAGKWDITGATFPVGSIIFADSAAGTSTGAQLLYQAIGAGNLRAYVQGQDDVGHAALAN